MNESYTREQYMKKEVDHHTYFLSVAKSNGITEARLHTLQKEIIASQCEHFNDIPLQSWDNLAYRRAFEIYTDGSKVPSLSCTVCALKAVAEKMRFKATGKRAEHFRK